MEGTTQARVLIAGGSELVRRGIRDVLSKDRRFSTVAEVERPVELPAACATHVPDVVVVDMGGAGGDNRPGEVDPLTALREALALDPRVAAIIVTDRVTIEAAQRAVSAGARGVLLRDAPARSLLEAVGDVLAGGAALDPRLTAHLFEVWRDVPADVQGAGQPMPLLAPSVLASLSPREREVLISLTQGRRNKEIAAELGVSVGTVKTHLRHIFRKLTVADRTAAVLFALRGEWREAA